MTDSNHPSVLRRLAAMLYDSLIVLSLLLIATALITPLAHKHHFSPNNHWFQAYLMLIVLAFYLGFWCHKGQTLGMLAWQFKVQTIQGQRLTPYQASQRFMLALISLACAGIGLFWQWFDKDNRSLYDRLSNTELVMTSTSNQTTGCT